MRRQADGRDNDEQDGERLKVGLRERERVSFLVLQFEFVSFY